jgi:hypothetical protein
MLHHPYIVLRHRVTLSHSIVYVSLVDTVKIEHQDSRAATFHLLVCHG